MLLIPALDLKNNFCVRLLKGNIKIYDIYSKIPSQIINKFINYNIKRIHIVDLNAAILGKTKNLFYLKYIIKTFNKFLIQIGGGIRSYDALKYYFDIGVNYVVLSTKIILNIGFFNKICNIYNNKIILALDIKNNNICINGWLNNIYNFNLIDFLKEIKSIPIESIICTDISKDGLLSGLNFKLVNKITNLINKPIIASGGLYNKHDIKNSFNFQNNNILGIICGKAIYSGNLKINNLYNKVNYFNNIIV